MPVIWKAGVGSEAALLCAKVTLAVSQFRMVWKHEVKDSHGKLMSGQPGIHFRRILTGSLVYMCIRIAP